MKAVFIVIALMIEIISCTTKGVLPANNLGSPSLLTEISMAYYSKVEMGGRINVPKGMGLSSPEARHVNIDYTFNSIMSKIQSCDSLLAVYVQPEIVRYTSINFDTTKTSSDSLFNRPLRYSFHKSDAAYGNFRLELKKTQQTPALNLYEVLIDSSETRAIAIGSALDFRHNDAFIMVLVKDSALGWRSVYQIWCQN